MTNLKELYESFFHANDPWWFKAFISIFYLWIIIPLFLIVQTGMYANKVKKRLFSNKRQDASK